MEYLDTGLNERLGLVEVDDSPEAVHLDMPVTDACMQPFGYVHGGATLALLEAAASWGARLRCDLDTMRPFGTHMDVHHIRSCTQGTVHGAAILASEEDLGPAGTRQVWEVSATDDAGRQLSVGTFTTRIVSLDYLESKESATM